MLRLEVSPSLIMNCTKKIFVTFTRFLAFVAYNIISDHKI